MPIEKKDLGQPERLSLDEFSRQKGQGNFVTVVSDIDKGSLLEVIDSHQSDKIIETLNQQPLEIRENVKEVSVDMWGGFPKVIKEVFPAALIVIDRFHVMKLVNKALNKIRLLLEFKSLKNRYLLMKNSENLTEDEKTSKVVSFGSMYFRGNGSNFRKTQPGDLLLLYSKNNQRSHGRY